MIPTAEQFEEAGAGVYCFLKVFPNGECAWLARMIFTWAILYGWRDHGHLDRWCYESLTEAKGALDDWNGEPGTEPEGWHRHPRSGRRRDVVTGREWVQP